MNLADLEVGQVVAYKRGRDIFKAVILDAEPNWSPPDPFNPTIHQKPDDRTNYVKIGVYPDHRKEERNEWVAEPRQFLDLWDDYVARVRREKAEAQKLEEERQEKERKLRAVGDSIKEKLTAVEISGELTTTLQGIPNGITISLKSWQRILEAVDFSKVPPLPKTEEKAEESSDAA